MYNASRFQYSTITAVPKRHRRQTDSLIIGDARQPLSKKTCAYVAMRFAFARKASAFELEAKKQRHRIKRKMAHLPRPYSASAPFEEVLKLMGSGNGYPKPLLYSGQNGLYFVILFPRH